MKEFKQIEFKKGRHYTISEAWVHKDTAKAMGWSP